MKESSPGSTESLNVVGDKKAVSSLRFWTQEVAFLKSSLERSGGGLGGVDEVHVRKNALNGLCEKGIVSTAEYHRVRV